MDVHCPANPHLGMTQTFREYDTKIEIALSVDKGCILSERFVSYQEKNRWDPKTIHPSFGITMASTFTDLLA